MQLITNLSLLAGVASTAMATSSSPAAASETCSTFSTTITSTVATVTITVTPGVEASSVAGPLSHSSITSGSCAAPATAGSSSVSVWTSTEKPSSTTPAAWTLSTYTGVNPTNPAETLTATHCASGSVIAGVNTVNGTGGTTYLVCAAGTASHPTVSTFTGKSTADAVGATHTSGFSFYPTGPANATGGPTGSGSGIAAPTTGIVAATQSVVPFTGGAPAINGKKAVAALAGIAVAMLFV
ncbi:hypothetical protein Slin15195_G073550 [Septoria linicola]|uniref:Uncharacterized protein n=1 Tax=Septoria linicola TaxID=215465 RepID=A0A9Q9AYD7_9PEZI|nr:hypothetical protein Slin14017_G034690 [Septoria linicola]USW54036.1 hypothetical protein Slin15195_G073550 [Septoria linicola]